MQEEIQEAPKQSDPQYTLPGQEDSSKNKPQNTSNFSNTDSDEQLQADRDMVPPEELDVNPSLPCIALHQGQKLICQDHSQQEILFINYKQRRLFCRECLEKYTKELVFDPSLSNLNFSPPTSYKSMHQ